MRTSMQKHCSPRQLPRRSLRDLRRKRGSVGGRIAALSMKNQRSNGFQLPPSFFSPFLAPDKLLKMSYLNPALVMMALCAHGAVCAYDEKLCNDGSYTNYGSGLTCKTSTCHWSGPASSS